MIIETQTLKGGAQKVLPFLGGGGGGEGRRKFQTHNFPIL